jgi:hypothetical protein
MSIINCLNKRFGYKLLYDIIKKNNISQDYSNIKFNKNYVINCDCYIENFNYFTEIIRKYDLLSKICTTKKIKDSRIEGYCFSITLNSEDFKSKNKYNTELHQFEFCMYSGFEFCINCGYIKDKEKDLY